MSDTEREPIVDRRASARMNDDPATDPAPEAAAEEEEVVVDSTAGSDEALGAELAAAKEQADQYYKNWQRSAADFINFKRRVEQERGEQARFANAATVINILPVFDDLERAVETMDAHLAGLNWAQGVAAIHRKFHGVMEAMGVSEIPAAGQDFDPALHEAIARQPGVEGRILHVVQKGYRLGDKVVRPAMVIVGEGGQ